MSQSQERTEAPSTLPVAHKKREPRVTIAKTEADDAAEAKAKPKSLGFGNKSLSSSGVADDTMDALRATGAFRKLGGGSVTQVPEVQHILHASEKILARNRLLVGSSATARASANPNFSRTGTFQGEISGRRNTSSIMSASGVMTEYEVHHAVKRSIVFMCVGTFLSIVFAAASLTRDSTLNLVVVLHLLTALAPFVAIIYRFQTWPILPQLSPEMDELYRVKIDWCVTYLIFSILSHLVTTVLLCIGFATMFVLAVALTSLGRATQWNYDSPVRWGILFLVSLLDIGFMYIASASAYSLYTEWLPRYLPLWFDHIGVLEEYAKPEKPIKIDLSSYEEEMQMMTQGKTATPAMSRHNSVSTASKPPLPTPMHAANSAKLPPKPGTTGDSKTSDGFSGLPTSTSGGGNSATSSSPSMNRYKAPPQRERLYISE